MRPPIEERAAAYVAKMDAAVAGSGGHNQTFYAACVLVHAFQLSDSASLSILQEFNSRCDPPWSEPDLLHKIQSAAGSSPSAKMLELREKIMRDARPEDRVARPPAGDSDLPPISAATRPEFNPEKLRELAAPWNESVSGTWLADRSAVDPCELDAAGYLKTLYPGGEKVLCFTNQMSQGEAMWPDQTPPAGARDGVWYLPQPVDGKYYPNPRTVDPKTGKPKRSRRSMESVTAWRYMLLESDEADLKDWLGLLVQLPLRIASIYSSGGRSVHALVRVDKKTKSSWDQVKLDLTPCLNLLCICGVDMKAITAVRLSRLPQCKRGRKLQKLYYVNPDPQVRPICELPALRNVEEEWCAQAELGIADSDETGGRWLFDALSYYAPASARCKEALEKLRELYE